ncbi:MAG: AAA family ATPase [Candidatus Kaiserbacteria bacterium]|nr:AAA family ATPase [Candidatus Kaiserbacteria bacterium]
MPSPKQFTTKAREAFEIAKEHVVENGHQNMSPVHLFAALVGQDDGLVQPILQRLGIDPYALREQTLALLEVNASSFEMQDGAVVQLFTTPELAMAIDHAGRIATMMKEQYVSTEHLFLAILEKPGVLRGIMSEFGLNSKEVYETILAFRQEEKKEDQQQKAKNLEKFGRNLTQLARENKLDPVIGRDEEMNRVIQILSRRTKNNPILIGEPGTGKTALGEGLAQRIVHGDVPESMRKKELISLDIVSMLAGTKFRGEFEDRLKKVMKEVEDASDQYIIFVDEVHTLVGAGSAEGTVDAANILKPALARGQMRMIGATTLKEYQQYVEKDGALTRRFQPVYISEPSIEDAVSILRGLRGRYEVYHGIRVTDAAIVAAVRLSSRYITERFLPDKAVDLIDEAASLVRVSLENKPPELDKVHRESMRLEIELEAMRKDYEAAKDEKTQARIEELEKEIADVKEKSRELEVRWKNEKETIEKIKELQTDLEKKRHEGEEAESRADYGRAAEIRYQDIPVLESSFRREQNTLRQLQKNRKMLREEITDEDIAAVISRWTGIPATKMLETEAKRLDRMDGILKKRIIGQNDPVEKITAAIKRSRAGIANPERPVGSFLFLGPTGVGKTALAKELARYLFDDEKALIRFDMSEYMERHTVSKLIGAPPGYVGYEESGKLTESVRHRPYSVVLFDEVEKAHPGVFDILLQVLDDGRLTDSKGRVVNFKNTIIILTSNVGSEQLVNMSQIGFGESLKKKDAEAKQNAEVRDRVMETLQKAFKPEFLNRLDEIIVFKTLDQQCVRKIVSILIAEAVDRLADRDISVVVEKEVYSKIAKEGYNAKFGARPLSRKIQTDLFNPLANLIIEKAVSEGSTITISVKEDEYTFAVGESSDVVPKKKETVTV